MRIIITGTPGTGKTTVAKALAKRHKSKYINEQELCIGQGIGLIDKKNKELVVPLSELQKALKRVLAKEKDFFLEGHLVCEIKIPIDLVVVLTCNPATLEKRLKKKGYVAEKVLDNLHCENIRYCFKKALKNFGKKRVLRVDNNKGIKKTLFIISKALAKLSSNRGC